jgi:hypothetical protein
MDQLEKQPLVNKWVGKEGSLEKKSFRKINDGPVS